MRAVWSPVLGSLSSVPVVDRAARPAARILGLVSAGLPLAIEGSALASRLTSDWPAVVAGEAEGDPTWQLPRGPVSAPELAALGSGIAGLQASIDSAVDCDCLGSAAGERLVGLQSSAADASWALTSYGPLAASFDDLAGFSGPRTYLLVVGNQAEMRPSGGAPLYAAVVTADSGLVRLADKGTTSTHFFPPLNRPVTWTGVEGNPYFESNPRTRPFVNAGANPDFAVSAQEMAAAFEAGGYPPVDGVVYVDLSLLQQLLSVTGPISVPGLGSISADTLVPTLLDTAYAEADTVEENAQRQAANDALFDALLTRVSSGMPAMPALRVIDEAVAGRHLQAWFRDPAAQSVFDEAGWTGRLVAPETGDWVAWYTQSGNPSKTDVKQGRSVVRTVESDGSQLLVTSDYVVANDNEPRADDDERRGYQTSWMRTAVVVYLPRDASAVTVSGLEGMSSRPRCPVRQRRGT